MKDRRIVGGYEVVRNSHPHQVALLLDFADGSSLCGGSILTPFTILTAAHCVEGGLYSALAIAGAHNRLVIESTQQRIYQEGYLIHENWDTNTITNDIALLYGPGFAFNSYVQAIPLPALGVSDQFVGVRTTVTGLWLGFT